MTNPSNTKLRNLMLYPAELRALDFKCLFFLGLLDWIVAIAGRVIGTKRKFAAQLGTLVAHCAAHGAMALGVGFAVVAAPAGAAQVEPVVTCTAVAVWDGDGPIRCREGWKLRLHGVAAREMSGICRPGHPCPDASGEAARDALVGLLGGRGRMDRDGHVWLALPARLRCTITGGSYGRLTGWCNLPDGRDLNCALVASGTALRWPRYWQAHRCPGVK
jgi:endonuclease YncB( thermonuclease family)